jgi:hypothetical protein
VRAHRHVVTMEPGGTNDPEPKLPFDAPPDAVSQEASSAFDDARPRELAVLVFDSLVDATDDPGSHQLRFEHQRLSLEVDVSSSPLGTTVEARTSRPDVTAAVLHRRGADIAFVSLIDPDGRFVFEPIGHGLVRLSIEADDGPAIWSDWFRI